MQGLRSKLLSFVLTLFVGIGLVTSALAHRLPTDADRALQILQAEGVPLSALCGQAGKTSCPDGSCPICPGGAALSGENVPTPLPVLTLFRHALVLPCGTHIPTVRLLLGHDAQAPPWALLI